VKKIIITGATGSIGKKLCPRLIENGNEVIIFTRNSEKAQKVLPGVKKFIDWNYYQPDRWKNELNGIDAVIHLAGANLGAKRWNKKYKRLAYDSRVISTRNLVEAIRNVDKKPKTFICASAVGYYGDRKDEELYESSIPAENYLANLCRDWEAEAAKIEEFGVRRVSVRTGLVLDNGEGILKQMVPAFKIFLGGYLGNGKQWFPWIHIDDVVNIYLYSYANATLNGAVNASSPSIVRNKEFSITLGKILRRPVLFPVPKIAVKVLKGEIGNYATDSQNVIPSKLLKSGYNFKFTNLEEALRDLLKNKRA